MNRRSRPVADALLRLLVGLVAALLLPALAVGFGRLCALWWRSQSRWPVMAGLAVGTLLDRIVHRRFARLAVAEHELTHALVAVLLFQRVRKIVVRHDGGSVTYERRFGGAFTGDLVGLAPYFLPTFALLLTCVRPLIPPPLVLFDLGVGVALGYHLWSTLRETRESLSTRPFRAAGSGEPTLSDIASRGRVYSLLVIAAASLATHAVVLALLVDSYRGVGAWARHVWRYTFAAEAWAVHAWRALGG